MAAALVVSGVMEVVIIYFLTGRFQELLNQINETGEIVYDYETKNTNVQDEDLVSKCLSKKCAINTRYFIFIFRCEKSKK